MKFKKNCEQDFTQVKNGDFLRIIAEKQKKESDMRYPLKYDQLIVKVIDKKKHIFMRFPKLSGNAYNKESLINKIIESLEWYETRTLKEKDLFSLMPQNYVIKTITPIKKKVIEEAFKRKQQHLQIQMNTIQKSINKLNADLKKSKILSWSIAAEFVSAVFLF